MNDAKETCLRQAVRYVTGVMLFACSLIVWAGAADVRSTIRTEDGGRIVYYTDGSAACFDKNDRPSKAASCKQTFKTADGGRIEFYLNGDVVCYDRNDRPSMGAGCKESVSDNALLLKAGELERAGNESTAKRYYESIIRIYPNSQAALRANDRLIQLADSEKAAERQRRSVEEMRAIAEQNKQAADARAEQARRDEDARFEQARRDAEEQQHLARLQHERNCDSGYSQCMAMCNGMSDYRKGLFSTTDKERCRTDCLMAKSRCR